MHHSNYFKVLSIACFVIGIILWLGGGDTFFHESGGTGLVIFVIGTPLFALLNKHTRHKSDSFVTQSGKLFRIGCRLLASGVVLYGTSFLGGNFGSVGRAFIGAFMVLVGIIILVVSTLKG